MKSPILPASFLAVLWLACNSLSAQYLPPDPNNIDYHLVRGKYRLQLQDFAGAIEDNNAVIRVDSENTYAWCNRGMAKAYMKDFKSAIPDLGKAIGLATHLQIGAA